MLTEVIIQTSTPTSLKINDVSPDEILILKSISNLSSTKVNQFIGDFAHEGSYYQGRRAEKRNPVFNFKINPNYAEDIEASDVREMLYRMFMEPRRDSDAVQVLLIDDRRPDRYFLGYTETIEADGFSKDIGAMVSLMTTDAYLRSSELTTESNEAGWFAKPLVYEGSADTGLRFTIKVLGQTSTLVVSNGVETMTFNHAFIPGDILDVSTPQGERYVRLNGVDKMATMTAGSKWIYLREQGNVLRVFGSVPSDGKAAITSYTYRAAWWGV